MKRAVAESTELDHSCLIFLSKGRDDFDGVNNAVNVASSASRAFECKTCNRQFPSFQALGGHRASHKKPRLLNGEAADKQQPMKPKTHECSVCGVEFAIGQALGGHMRRHKEAGGLHGSEKLSALSLADTAPLVKKANSTRRVLCLDLNLTPYENDLEFYRLGSRVESLI